MCMCMCSVDVCVNMIMILRLILYRVEFECGNCFLANNLFIFYQTSTGNRSISNITCYAMKFICGNAFYILTSGQKKQTGSHIRCGEIS